MSDLARLADVAEVLPGVRGPEDFGKPEGHPRLVRPQAGDIRVFLLDEGKPFVLQEPGRGSGYAGGVTLRVKAHDRLVPAWLLAWAESPHFQNQIPKNLPDNIGLKATSRILAEFSIPLPTLSYQQELAARLKPLEAVSEAMDKMKVELASLRRAESALAVGRALSDRRTS